MLHNCSGNILLFLLDGLLLGVSIVDVDDEQSWNKMWQSAACDVIHVTNISVHLSSHVISAVSVFLVGGGADGAGADIPAEVDEGVGAGATLLPLPHCFSGAYHPFGLLIQLE